MTVTLLFTTAVDVLTEVNRENIKLQLVCINLSELYILSQYIFQ